MYTKRVVGLYTQLTVAVQKCFTSVQIQSVLTSRSHDYRQGPQKLVDVYVQNLHNLFYQAYCGGQKCGGEAKTMGKSVLAYQFVAGLHSDLKAKLVGCEGDFVELLDKTWFEEANIRESAPAQKQVQQKSNGAKKRCNGRNAVRKRCVCIHKGRRCLSCLPIRNGRCCNSIDESRTSPHRRKKIESQRPPAHSPCPTRYPCASLQPSLVFQLKIGMETDGVTIQARKKLLNRLPLASRELAAKHFTSALDEVVCKSDLHSWSRLFNCAQNCLSVRQGGRKKRSLASAVNEQTRNVNVNNGDENSSFTPRAKVTTRKRRHTNLEKSAMEALGHKVTSKLLNKEISEGQFSRLSERRYWLITQKKPLQPCNGSTLPHIQTQLFLLYLGIWGLMTHFCLGQLVDLMVCNPNIWRIWLLSRQVKVVRFCWKPSHHLFSLSLTVRFFPRSAHLFHC